MTSLKKFKPIKISKPAEVDLKNIAVYTLKKWGKLQQKTYLSVLKQSLSALSLSDNSFLPLTKSRDDVDIGLSSYRIKKHVVYYRETEQEFLIIRILHSHMEPEKHLPFKTD